MALLFDCATMVYYYCHVATGQELNRTRAWGVFHPGAGGDTALLEWASDRPASCAFPGQPADAALNCRGSRMSRGFGAAGLLFRMRVVDYTFDSHRGRTTRSIRTFTIRP